jgi:glycosyltransferase involved in cell wall biosynthesis
MPGKSVLLTAMSLDYGGAETHVVDLASELTKFGWHVVVASQGGRLVPELARRGITHHIAPLHSRSPLQLLAAVNSVASLARSHRSEILHAHGRIPAWVCAQVQKSRQDTPLLTTYHGVYASGFPWNLVTREGDLTIAVSEDVKTHLVLNLGFDRSKISVIPNGIDTSRFRPAPAPELRHKLLQQDDAPLLLNVSRLDGIFAEPALALVEALFALERQLPGITAVIVGDGDRAKEINRECVRINAMLGRRAALMAGAQHDVVPYLLSADVVVAVARAALEAMACEKPVVFAGEGGMRGAISEQKLHVLREHNFTARGSGEPITCDSMASAVSELLQEPGAAADAARAGRNMVRTEYSWEVLTPKILEVYDRALALRR